MQQFDYCFCCSCITHTAASGMGSSRVHSAAHYGPSTGPLPSRPQPYNRDDHGWGAFKPLMGYHGHNPPGVKSVGVRVHKQAHPGASESTLPLSRGTSNPVQSQYTAYPVSRLPRGHTVINRKSYFEEVKPAAPPVLPAAPGWPNAVSWDPQGQTKPGSFVYRERDLVNDESAPNRHGVFRSGFSLPRSWSHGPYQRGLTGYGPAREAAAPRSDVPVMSRGPVDRMKRIWVPSMNVKQFGQGNPVIKHVMTKIRFI